MKRHCFLYKVVAVVVVFAMVVSGTAAAGAEQIGNADVTQNSCLAPILLHAQQDNSVSGSLLCFSEMVRQRFRLPKMLDKETLLHMCGTKDTGMIALLYLLTKGELRLMKSLQYTEGVCHEVKAWIARAVLPKTPDAEGSPQEVTVPSYVRHHYQSFADVRQLIAGWVKKYVGPVLTGSPCVLLVADRRLNGWIFVGICLLLSAVLLIYVIVTIRRHSTSTEAVSEKHNEEDLEFYWDDMDKLTSILTKTQDPEERYYVATGLMQHAHKLSGEAMEALVGALTDKHSKVVEAAGNTLAEAGNVAIVSIVESLEQAPARSKQRMLRLLRKFSEVPESNVARSAIKTALLDTDAQYNTSGAGVDVVLHFGKSMAGVVLDALNECPSEETERKIELLNLLSEIPEVGQDDPTVDLVTQIAVGQTDDPQVIEAARSLLRVMGASTASGLERLYLESDDAKRILLIDLQRMLAVAGPDEAQPEALAFLLWALKDGSESVSQHACEALQRLGTEAVPVLAETMQTGDDDVQKEKIAELLADIAAANLALIKVLQAHSGAVRRRASEGLLNMGDDALPLLKQSLVCSTEPNEKRKILDLIGQMSANQNSYEAREYLLNRALHDGDPAVRSHAVDKLVSEGSKVIPLLLAQLKGSLAGEKKVLVLNMLGRIPGYKEDEDIVETLVGFLKQGRDKLDQAAGGLLVAVGEKAILPLAARLEKGRNTSEESKRRIIEILMQIPQARELHTVLRALAMALRGAAPEVARQALQEIGKPAIPHILRVLAEADRDSDILAMIVTLGEMPDIGNNRAAMSALGKLLKEGWSRVREVAAKVLIDIDGKSIPALLVILRSRDSKHKIIALEVLGQIPAVGNNSTAMNAIVQAVSEAAPKISSGVCQAGFRALGRIGQSSIPVLVTAIRECRVDKKKARLITALGLIPYFSNNSVAMEVLREASGSNSPMVMSAATSVLVSMGRKGILLFVEMLHNGELDHKLVALKAMGRIDRVGFDKDARGALLYALQYNDPKVSNAAHEAILEHRANLMPFLEKRIQSSDNSGLQQRLVEVMGRIARVEEGDRTKEFLVQLLAHEDGAVANSAFDALQRLNGKAKFALAKALKQGQGTPVSKVRAIALLGQRPNDIKYTLVKEALELAMRDSDPDVRETAASVVKNAESVAIPMLTGILEKGGDECDKQQAIGVLGQITQAMFGLLAALQDSSEGVYETASSQLVAIGEPAVSFIASAFAAANSEHRIRLIRVLGQIAISETGMQARTSLVSRLALEQDDSLQALEAQLVNLGQRALPALVQGLQDGNELGIIRVLGKIKDTRDNADVLQVLVEQATKDGEVGQAAAGVLQRIGSKAIQHLSKALHNLLQASDKIRLMDALAGIPTISDDSAAMLTIANTVKHPEQGVRERAEELALSIGHPIVPLLEKVLNEAELGEHVNRMIGVLGRMAKREEGSDAKRALVGILKKNQVNTYQPARDTIVKLGHIMVPSLEKAAYSNGDYGYQELLIGVLDDIAHTKHGAAAIGALARLLGHQRPQVQITAGQALTRLGAKVIPALVEVLKSRTSGSHKARIISLLREIEGVSDNGPAMDAIIQALPHQESVVTYQAALTLESLGSRAVQPVTAALEKSQNQTHRIQFLRVLGQIARKHPASQAAQSIVVALQDHEVKVKEVAIEELARIGQSSIPLLMDELRKANEAEMLPLLASLGGIPELAQHGEAMQLMVTSLSHSAPAVRDLAAEVLAAAGEGAIPWLLQGFGSQNGEIIRLLPEIAGAMQNRDVMIALLNAAQGFNSSVRREADALLQANRHMVLPVLFPVLSGPRALQPMDLSLRRDADVINRLVQIEGEGIEGYIQGGTVVVGDQLSRTSDSIIFRCFRSVSGGRLVLELIGQKPADLSEVQALRVRCLAERLADLVGGITLSINGYTLDIADQHDLWQLYVPAVDDLLRQVEKQPVGKKDAGGGARSGVAEMVLDDRVLGQAA